MAQAFYVWGLRGVHAVDRYRRRKRAPGGEEVLAEDDRPPVLYLRSFEVDNREGLLGSGGPLDGTMSFVSEPFEARLTEDLTEIGPVVAIGMPGERLKPLGAARLYCEDDQWQERVEELISASAAIVFVCEIPTEGFMWEIDRIAELANPTMVLGLVMGDRMGRFGDTYQTWAEQVEPRLPRGLPPLETLPSVLGAKESDDTPRAWLTFEADWTPRFIKVHEYRFEPPPSTVLSNARWASLARSGTRVSMATSEADPGQFAEARWGLLEAIDLAAWPHTMNESFSGGLDGIRSARSMVDSPAEVARMLGRAREHFDAARATATDQIDLLSAEMCMGLTDLVFGDLGGARSWLRVAYDRASAIVIEISERVRKVSFDGCDHDFASVDGVAAWIAAVASDKQYRKRSLLAPFLEALATLIDCLAEVHHSTDPDAPRLPSLTCERSSWSDAFEMELKITITARLPTDLSGGQRELLERRRSSARSADVTAAARAATVARAEEALGPPVDEWTAALYCFLVDFPRSRWATKVLVAPDIPSDWLSRAAQWSELPDDEVAIGMLNYGQKSGKATLIFGQQGLYFNNETDLGSISPGPNLVTYESLSREQPRFSERRDSIRLGQDAYYDHALEEKQLVAMFVQLSDLAAEFND